MNPLNLLFNGLLISTACQGHSVVINRCCGPPLVYNETLDQCVNNELEHASALNIGSELLQVPYACVSCLDGNNETEFRLQNELPVTTCTNGNQIQTLTIPKNGSRCIPTRLTSRGQLRVAGSNNETEYYSPKEFCVIGSDELEIKFRVCNATCTKEGPCIRKCCNIASILDLKGGVQAAACVRSNDHPWKPRFYSSPTNPIPLAENDRIQPHYTYIHPSYFCTEMKPIILEHEDSPNWKINWKLRLGLSRNFYFRKSRYDWGENSEYWKYSCVDGAINSSQYGKDHPDVFEGNQEEDVMVLCIPENATFHDNGTVTKVPTWPGGVVPYAVGPGLEPIHSIIKEVAKEFSHKTCIRFVPKKPSDEHYVQFIRNDSLCGRATHCKSSGVQTVWMGKDCFHYKTIVQELGHAICVSDEHQRPDRDEFITLKCEQYVKNYDEYSKLGLLYDYTSVMHINDCSGTCLKPTLSGVTKCGGKELSVLDAEKINSFYNCGDCHGYRFRPFYWNQSEFFVAGVDKDGTGLGVCRAYMKGDIALGQMRISDNETHCRIPSGRVEEFSPDFEVLTQVDNKHFGWHSMTKGEMIPYHSIPGGWSKDREPQFIGRCNTTHENETVVIPGGIYHARMYYAYWLHGHECENFQVLRYTHN